MLDKSSESTNKKENKLKNILNKLNSQIINTKKIENSNINQAGRDVIIINGIKKREFGFVITTNNYADSTPTNVFQGRVTEIKEIEALFLNCKKRILIHGMGGIGKTEICKTIYQEYLDRNHNCEKIKFEHIAYLKYENDIDETILNAFQSYLTKNDKDEEKQVIEKAWNFVIELANKKNILLIIDGVDKHIKKDQNLDRLNSLPCYILMSSRNRTFKEFYPYEIGMLEYDYCLAIFTSIYGEHKNSDKSDLEYVINKIAVRHTLTVKLLACVARDNSWTIENLKNELERKHFAISYLKDEEEEILIEEYKKLFELSSLNEDEINILEAFSIFPYHMLPIEYCKKWLCEDLDMDSIALLINRLNRKGWLETEDGKFAMHPVISETIQSIRDIILENHKNLILTCIESLYLDINKIKYMEIPYSLFAESLIEKLYEENSLEIAVLSTNVAKLAYYQANYEKAEEYNMKALLIYESVLGDKNLFTADTYNNLANIYHDLGEYQKAELLLLKALSVFEKLLDIDSPLLANSYHMLANSYYNLAGTNIEMGKFQQALEYNNKALLINEKVCDLNSPKVMNSYAQKAKIYYASGEYEKALKLYEKALSIHSVTKNKDNYSVGNIYLNMGELYDELCKYPEALNLYKKALAIQIEVLEQTNGDIASTYNNMGVTYRNLEDYEKALEYYDKSLTIRLELYGNNHLTVGKSYNNIGAVHHSRRAFGEAKTYYKKALSIYKKASPVYDLEIATTYNNLAEVYCQQNKFNDAISLMKKSIIINEKMLGLEHLHTAKTYHNIANVFYQQKKYEASLDFYNKALKIQKKIYADDHLDIATTYFNIAIIYSELGNYVNEKAFIKKAYEIYLKLLGSVHPDTRRAFQVLCNTE